jgi:hypothetical protein
MNPFGKTRGTDLLVVAVVAAFVVPKTYGFDHNEPIPSGIASLFYGRYVLAADAACILVTLRWRDFQADRELKPLTKRQSPSATE